jgi:RNA polymerase sigma factor (sigma-70 family)
LVLIPADARYGAVLQSFVMTEHDASNDDPSAHANAEKPLSDAIVAELVRNHRELLRFVERRVGSRAEAEDILQDAFVRSVQQAGTLRDGDASTAWFYRMLRNAIVDRFRRRGAADRALAAFARELGGEDGEAVPTLETTNAVCECIRSLASTLKPEYAQAIERIDVDEVSVQDFAAEAGISANNAAVRVHRAREALRKRVATTCGTCAEHGCVDCSCVRP